MDQNPPPLVLQPGNAYTLHSGDCLVTPEADLIVGGKVSSAKSYVDGWVMLIYSRQMCSNDTYLSYYNSQNECAMGIFVEIS